MFVRGLTVMTKTELNGETMKKKKKTKVKIPVAGYTHGCPVNSIK